MSMPGWGGGAFFAAQAGAQERWARPCPCRLADHHRFVSVPPCLRLPAWACRSGTTAPRASCGASTRGRCTARWRQLACPCWSASAATRPRRSACRCCWVGGRAGVQFMDGCGWKSRIAGPVRYGCTAVFNRYSTADGSARQGGSSLCWRCRGDAARPLLPPPCRWTVLPVAAGGVVAASVH